jgi:hypothetical protein
LLVAAVAGCSASQSGEKVSLEAPYLDHDEPSDFVVDEESSGKADGVPASFDRNHVLDEEFFLRGDALDADEIQQFLAESPYGTRCWLADEWIGELRFADALATTSTTAGLNPIVLLARMQVEKGLISKTSRPAQSKIDHALGCGCPDGSGCSDSYAGLDNQLDCAAEVFVEQHDGSVDETGEWRVGRSKKSLDGYWVKPVNHATAAMYGYTPWVLPGSGGNWLVWNVTRKFVRHSEALGFVEQ